MLHTIGFEEELHNMKSTEKLLDTMWNKYMHKKEYNSDWRDVLQKLSDLIGAIKTEHDEYIYYEKSICKRKCKQEKQWRINENT